MKKFSLIFFLVPISLLPLLSQETLPEQDETGGSQTEEEEASPFIWEYEMDDEEVELFWEGYWKLSMSGGLGYTHTPEGDYFPSQYPGLTNIIGFDQEPDLLLSLWLNKRWFMETSFVKDFDQNTFALGFEEDEWFINHLRLGNSNLDVQGFAGLTPPAPEFSTPGLLMEAAGPSSQHEMLVRLDGSTKEIAVYQGSYLVSDEIRSLGDWQEGRSFVLPNTDWDKGSLQVYLQSSSGTYSGSDGKRYRLMEAGEYDADPEEGLLDLTKPAAGRLLVLYTKGGSDIGSAGLATAILPDIYGNTGIIDPANSTSFEWNQPDIFIDPSGLTDFSATRQITLSGKTALLLKDPGVFSPFEFTSFYESGINFSEEEWKNGAELVYKNSYRTVEEISLTLEKEEEGVRIYRPGISIRDTRNRYPLQEVFPQLYGPAGYGTAESGQVMLRLYSLQNSSGYNLPQDLIKDSLQIYINGYATADYQIEEGNIRFNRFIYPGDRIEIHYRRENPNYEGGEFLFYQGNALGLGERNNLELGGQLRWILPGGTQEFQEGVITLSGVHRYQGEQLQSTLSIQGSLTDPDTDGLNRLLSMENDRTEVSIYPGALQSSYDSFTDTAMTDDPLNAVDFIPLVEQDYDDPDEGLQNYVEGPVGTTGSEGPSAAATRDNDPFETPVMVFPVDLTVNEWTGGSLMLQPEGSAPLDLSTLQEMKFRLKWLNGTGGTLNIDLLLGQTGESEDYDDDGSLNVPDTDYYVLRPAVSSPTSSWTDVTLTFTDQERVRLQKASSLTLIVHDDDRAQALSGTLLVGDIRYYGPSFSAAGYDTSGDLTDLDILAREVADSSLESAFSSEMDQLHQSGEDQRVSRIEWGTATGASVPVTMDPNPLNEYWEASRQLSSPVNRDFRYLNFFIRDLDAGSGTADYTLSYLDDDGKGLVIGFAPGAANTSWKKVRFNLQEGILESSDSSISLISWDEDAEDLSRLEIRGESDGSGGLEIDEVYQEESIYQLSSQSQWDLTYQSPAEWTTEGGFPLFSGFRLSSKVTGRSFERLGYADDRELSFRQVLDMESNLTLFYLGGWIDYSITSAENRVEGGHRLRVPWFEFPFHFSEGFRSTDGQDALKYSQERSLVLRTESLPVSLELRQESQRYSEEREQNWSGRLDFEQEKFNGSLGGDFNLTREEDAPGNPQDYLENWAESWRDTAVRRGDHRQRVSDLSVRQNWLGDSLSLEIQWNFHQLSSFTPLWTSTGDYSSALTLPITFGEENRQQNLEFSYNRGKTWKKERPYREYFSTDWQDYGGSWAASLPLIREIPLAELFSPSYDPVTGLDQQNDTYRVSAGASYSRQSGSRISDLFVPSGVSTDFLRLYQQNQEENWYRSDWTFTLDQQALNLFGRFGAYSLFDFYLSDEIRNSWSYKMSSYNDPLPDPSTLGWNFYLSLKGERELKSSWDNQLDLDFTQEETREQIQWDLSWRTFSKPYYKVPGMDWIIDREFYVEQLEGITYSLANSWDHEENTEQEFFLEHHWLLHFTGWGTLDSWLKWAYRNEEDIWQSGAELGFEMKITF